MIGPVWRGWGLFLLLAVAMLLLQLAGEPARALLRFEREAVLAGEFWRLLTAHLVHLGWAHCLLNLAGLLLCRLLCPELFRDRRWLPALLVLMAGTGILLLVAAPQVADYVGFSGVLYGLFLLGLWPQLRRGDRIALLALGILAGRALWQLLAGASAGEEEMIGGRIIAEAHVFGMLVAGIWLLAAGWQAAVPSGAGRRGRD